TLFDWLAAKDKRTRALSVSKKDRGAILPIGRAKQNVYWFSANGSFTTSTYYRDTLPIVRARRERAVRGEPVDVLLRAANRENRPAILFRDRQRSRAFVFRGQPIEER